MLEKSGWGQDGSKGLGVLGGRVPPPAPPIAPYALLIPGLLL